MATFKVRTIGIDGKTLYSGKSFNTARDACNTCPEPCAVLELVRYNDPMPVLYWNSAFSDYVESRGRVCKVGMTAY